MTYQAAVKTSPHQQGAHVVTFGDRESRLGYVRGPQVFWYKMAEDDEIFDPGGWRRGGAWAATEDPELAVNSEPEDVPADEGERW